MLNGFGGFDGFAGFDWAKDAAGQRAESKDEGEKLDRWDVLGLLKEWELEQVRLRRIFDDLSKTFGSNPECELFEAMWGNFTKYSEMLERVLGDKNGTLIWYWIDNKMGKGGLKAIVNGKERVIEGLKDLAWLIGTDSDKEGSV